jgi:hypothetical protein
MKHGNLTPWEAEVTIRESSTANVDVQYLSTPFLCARSVTVDCTTRDGTCDSGGSGVTMIYYYKKRISTCIVQILSYLIPRVSKYQHD